jgi:ABC-type multidrug transport system fused ATPase/permease subunit
MGQGHLPMPTEEEVWAACDAANVTEFVHSFPNGLHTFIGEKGVKLSGGQKQRVAIARAIIRTPTILLLDEATSALDSVNEKEVQKALDMMLLKHQGVAIVIAHRLTTVKNCDKICVIDKGSVVEQGSHSELMAIDVERAALSDGEGGMKIIKGHYHTMWDTQMGEETFADAKLMSDEQLQGKLRFHRDEVARLEAEEGER